MAAKSSRNPTVQKQQQKAPLYYNPHVPLTPEELAAGVRQRRIDEHVKISKQCSASMFGSQITLKTPNYSRCGETKGLTVRFEHKLAEYARDSTSGIGPNVEVAINGQGWLTGNSAFKSSQRGDSILGMGIEGKRASRVPNAIWHGTITAVHATHLLVKWNNVKWTDGCMVVVPAPEYTSCLLDPKFLILLLPRQQDLFTARQM